jgi:predicted nucleic acid-binding protein
VKPVFVDSMGWACLLDRREAKHGEAARLMAECARGRRPLVTTDYVVDETATLLMARRAGGLLGEFFELLGRSAALTLTPVGMGRFREACGYLLKHRDQGYSFTDVTSFIVMRELGMSEALTEDRHFEQAGFRRLL